MIKVCIIEVDQYLIHEDCYSSDYRTVITDSSLFEDVTEEEYEILKNFCQYNAQYKLITYHPIKEKTKLTTESILKQAIKQDKENKARLAKHAALEADRKKKYEENKKKRDQKKLEKLAAELGKKIV